MWIKRRLTMAILATALTALASTALAQPLATSVQKCIDQYNNKLRLVSQAAGKSATGCIKDAGKGAQPDPNGCVNGDLDGKIAAKQAKVFGLYPGTCSGSEPIQQGFSAGNTAHRNAISDLAHDLFDDPIAGVISPGSAQAKCQKAAIQRATQLFTAAANVFRKCKKSGMQAGTITDSATLEAACMSPVIPDPKGKITGKAAKLVGDVTGQCVGLSLATLFPGLDGTCHVSSAALAACAEQRTYCRLCGALNDADGTARDCDLFDDGLANASCGFALHTCTLDTTPTSDSQFYFHVAAIPGPMIFSVSGTLNIGTGGQSATCEISNLNPVTIPAIGVVCLAPAPGCAAGARWCGPGPGPAMGTDMQSDGLVGACSTQAQCDATCAAFCSPDTVQGAGCTSHCSGTTEQACTADSQCAPSNGYCHGPDPVMPAQAGICQCSCVDTAAHGPSDPGDGRCNLGVTGTVEAAAPCNGTDTTIFVGSGCVPVSTQRASALISDANFTGGTFVPASPNVNDLSGAPVACATADTSTLTGLVGVGAGNIFGTTLGDLSLGVRITCQ